MPNIILGTGEPPPPKPGDGPIRQVDWPESRRFAAIQSQLLDFDIALNALARFQSGSREQTDPMIRHALYATALVYYARAFKSGVRKGRSIQSLGLGKEEMANHERLTVLRDKWIAHSVNALDQVAVGIALSGFEGDARVLDVVRMRIRSWDVSNEDAARDERFVRTVRSRVQDQNQQSYEALIARARKTPVAELQKWPELGLIAPGHDLTTAKRSRSAV